MSRAHKVHLLYKEKDFWWKESRKSFDNILKSILLEEGKELEQHSQQYELAKQRYSTATDRLFKIINKGS